MSSVDASSEVCVMGRGDTIAKTRKLAEVAIIGALPGLANTSKPGLAKKKKRNLSLQFPRR